VIAAISVYWQTRCFKNLYRHTQSRLFLRLLWVRLALQKFPGNFFAVASAKFLQTRSTSLYLIDSVKTLKAFFKNLWMDYSEKLHDSGCRLKAEASTN